MSSPAATRARRLRRGINLSHWFSQIYWPPGYTAAYFDTYIRTSDIALIRDMGFDHVRLPINPAPLLAVSAPDGRLPAADLARILARITDILDHGLAVIVDLHPEDAFKQQLAADPAVLGSFFGFWHHLGTALAGIDPERVFLEVLNEPCLRDPLRWNKIQNAAVAVIRAAAPRHTIIISGDEWSQLPELLKLTPPADDNLIANFHLYDPSAFTHQGAGWAAPWHRFTKGLSYPADPANVTALRAAVTDPDALAKLDDYLAVGWNAGAYHRFLQPAVDWAREHRLPLTCNEFGVYKVFSARPARLAWVRDVSAALTSAGIGWTMWDYAGDFSVVTKQGDRRVPDFDLLHALGLPAQMVA